MYTVYCRQVEAEVISNSSSKIHQTWCADFSRSLYVVISVLFRAVKIVLFLSYIILETVLAYLQPEDNNSPTSYTAHIWGGVVGFLIGYLVMVNRKGSILVSHLLCFSSLFIVIGSKRRCRKWLR